MKSTPLTAYKETLGMIYFARLLDKVRLHDRGDLREDFLDFVGKGLDARCAKYLRVDYEAIRERTLGGETDEDVLRWCFEQGRELSEGDIEIWNEFIRKLGWRDFVTESLIKRKKESGLEDREDIETMIDYLEVDEGRKG